MFAARLVILFPVVRGGGPVRVRGEVVEFGSSLVRVVWHKTSILVAIQFKAVPFSALCNIEHWRRRPLIVP